MAWRTTHAHTGLTHYVVSAVFVLGGGGGGGIREGHTCETWIRNFNI